MANGIMLRHVTGIMDQLLKKEHEIFSAPPILSGSSGGLQVGCRELQGAWSTAGSDGDRKELQQVVRGFKRPLGAMRGREGACKATRNRMRPQGTARGCWGLRRPQGAAGAAGAAGASIICHQFLTYNILLSTFNVLFSAF
jgi:hypothetical protein